MGASVRVVVLACIASACLSHPARAQSATDGFNPGANGAVNALSVQSDGMIVLGGAFTMLGGGAGTTTRNCIGRIKPDGALDSTFDPGADNSISAIAIQSNGKIVLGGQFTMLGGGGTGTTLRSSIGRLNADGTPDDAFNPGANGAILALAMQPDGKILVGGDFTTIGGGGTGSTVRNHIARLNSDGSVDATFDPGASARVRAIVVQTDGKIVLGGDFVTIGNGGNGTMRSYIGRVGPNGTVDGSFDPGADGAVNALALQTDGRIVVGGSFTMLGLGATIERERIARVFFNGSLDNFDPGANADVRSIAIQADGRVVVAGNFTMLGGGGTGTTARAHIGRLLSDGSLDSVFDADANQTVVGAVAAQPDGKILVGGDFTSLTGVTGATARNRIARLYANGSVDADLNPGTNNSVAALALQPDGKILVGGDFSMIGGGGTGTTARSRIARLYPDGAVEAAFDPGANGFVYTMAVQPDGKILVGGLFTMLGGGGTGTTPRHYIGRLNADGSLDTDFDPVADNVVYAIALQPDGKILLGGSFTSLVAGGGGVTPRRTIARLNPDGNVDLTFNPGGNGFVSALALQPDGKILVGGYFQTLGGGGTGSTPRSNIGRINPDGSLDTFDPGTSGNSAYGTVYTLVVQPDGNILAGGQFTGIGNGTGSVPRQRIARLLPDGSVDPSFDPGADNWVEELALQSDGSILVGGSFGMLGGGGTGTAVRKYVGRVHGNGSIDSTFNPGSSGEVAALAVQSDGKVLIAGSFAGLGGGTGTTTRRNIGRVTNTSPTAERLDVSGSGSVVIWSRSGPGPEVPQVTFDLTFDGTSYTPMGVGVRVPGGWRLSGQNLPLDQVQFLRARGYAATGSYNGSASLVASVFSAYAFPMPFTDDPLVAGTTIKAIHVTELRNRINTVRAQHGIFNYPYTNSVLSPGTSVIRAVDILEMRTALADVYVKIGQTPPAYGTNPTPGGSIVVADITSIRAALLAIE